ncbi:unnamed protein product [Ilex paraguariensis]|uniref:SAP30-binding protein n=1 Tax=Ilex paraguariensis TaxID=185542 RepID=A0ABC8S5Y4_9AQUA
MASGKKESEGIALLSIYGDEDEEMEYIEDHQNVIVNDNIEANISEGENRIGEPPSPPPPPQLPEKEIINDHSTPLTSNFETSTPKQSPISLSSPQPLQLVGSDTSRGPKGMLTIVDYGHDEAAMSPEAEEGEITTTGHVVFGEELQMENGNFHENPPPGTVEVITPLAQATPQLSDQHGLSQSDAMTYALNESVSEEVEEAIKISVEEPKEADPLDKFLLPPPKDKCSDELQKRIVKFLTVKNNHGRSFNAEVRKKKEYRNPDFLLHAVTYQDIDEIGSCFSKDVFDPRGYDKSDYYKEIEADMSREMERKEQERKKNPKVEFLLGGTQPGTVVPVPKVSVPTPGVAIMAGGALQSVPAAVDVAARDGRQNKKSKWDKVDGDRRNPLDSGGQDSVSAVGVHTALLSAASAGTGYTAFVFVKETMNLNGSLSRTAFYLSYLNDFREEKKATAAAGG